MAPPPCTNKFQLAGLDCDHSLPCQPACSTRSGRRSDVNPRTEISSIGYSLGSMTPSLAVFLPKFIPCKYPKLSCHPYLTCSLYSWWAYAAHQDNAGTSTLSLSPWARRAREEANVGMRPLWIFAWYLWISAGCAQASWPCTCVLKTEHPAACGVLA